MAKQGKTDVPAAGAAVPETGLAVQQPPSLLANLPRTSDPGYAIQQLAKDAGGDVKLALRENLGGAAVSAFDFERLRVPSGGMAIWDLTNPNSGDSEPAAQFEAIVVSWQDQKAYWKQSLDGKDAKRSPPDCFSPDLIKGRGDPGIYCATCPKNVFGSDQKGGRGKACKDTRMIFLVRPHDVMPTLLIAPPTSLKAVKTYFMKLASRGIPFWSAVTRFKLVKAKNAAGTDYAVIDPTLVTVLEGEARGAAMEYSASIKAMLGKETIVPRREDLEGDGAYSGAPGTPDVPQNGPAASGGDWTQTIDNDLPKTPNSWDK